MTIGKQEVKSVSGMQGLITISPTDGIMGHLVIGATIEGIVTVIGHTQVGIAQFPTRLTHANGSTSYK